MWDKGLSDENLVPKPGNRTRSRTMSFSSSAKTKKLLPTSQLKTLDLRSHDADQMLTKDLTDDDTQCDVDHGVVGEFICQFKETIRKIETLFEDFAPMVFELVATKSAEKEIKRKEEESLETIVAIITESNSRLANLKGKQSALASKRILKTSVNDQGTNATNIQIDTSGLEKSLEKLSEFTQSNIQSITAQY